jgi:hypothetical protein
VLVESGNSDRKRPTSGTKPIILHSPDWKAESRNLLSDRAPMTKYFPTSKRNGFDPLYKGRITSLSQMNYFALFFFVLSTLSASATPPTVRRYKSSREAFEGPDRTITWRAWKEASGGEFRVRTGDRYLGGQVWEHYLGFELYRASVKPIKLSMIRLGSEAIPEEVVIRPGLRYAIVKVSNDTMTAHKGMWSWTAQEVATEPWLALF